MLIFRINQPLIPNSVRRSFELRNQTWHITPQMPQMSVISPLTHILLVMLEYLLLVMLVQLRLVIAMTVSEWSLGSTPHLPGGHLTTTMSRTEPILRGTLWGTELEEEALMGEEFRMWALGGILQRVKGRRIPLAS